jgi:hypothetical protein
MVNTKNRTVCIVFSVAIVCACVGMIVGLTLHFTLNNDDNETTLMPMTSLPTVSRQAAVGNCLPENVDNETLCISRG